MLNWIPLIQAIKEGKCLILLGPQFLEAETEKGIQPLTNRLWDRLREDYQHDILSWYEQDELFLFKSKAAKNDAYFVLKALLEEQKIVPDLFYKISSIRLPLLVSFSPFFDPESLLKKAEVPWNFSSRHYHMKRGEESLPIPSMDRPMIYELFGSIREEESMVLTYADLFDYIKAILGAKELDTGLKSIFKRTRYFIFLGFQFDKWYVQLVLRLLKSIKGENSEATWTAPQEPQHQPIVEFLNKEFSIRFIQKISNVRDFVQSLHEKCEEEGLLRAEKSSNGQARAELLSERIAACIAGDELDEALDLAISFFEKGRMDKEKNECYGLSGRLSRLQQKESKGIISSEEANLERNKIRDTLLVLKQKISEFE